jgi:nucleotide-binding universal stress UspA family protein
MKSILVPIGGSDSDSAVLDTAVAAAKVFGAHLNFVHIRVGAGEAAAYTPHVGFVRGPALVHALDELASTAERRSTTAAQHVLELCARTGIDMVEGTAAVGRMTASWREESNNARNRLLAHARHNDLVVMGRAARPNGLPPDLIETLLLECGRPILLACATAPRHLTGTVMVCWRESADSARAMAAALPFLGKAERLVLVSVDEGNADVAQALEDMAAQFRRHGIRAEAQVLAPSKQPIAALLSSTAQACGADLVVMGAYGHSRMREVLFGGCTQSVIQGADYPVLLMH